MTGKSSSAPRTTVAALPLAALALMALALLGGCFASRAPVPTQDLRVTEAEGRKARMEREAAEAAAATSEAAKPVVKKEPQPAPAQPEAKAEAKVEAKPEAKPEAKVEAKTEAPAPAAAPAPVAETAKAEAPKEQPQAPAPAPKAEAAPALSAEQLPAKELTLQGQYVQIASFGTEKNAQNAVAWLSANGYPSSRVVRVEQGGSVLHRVQAGPFQDPAAARGALDALKAQWPQAFIPAD